MTTPPTQTQPPQTTGRVAGQRQVAALRYALTATGAVSDRLALSLAHRMYFTVRKRPMQTGERAALERATAGKITAGKRTVPTYAWGTGARAVVFVHGWEGSGAQVQAFLPPLLGAGYKVVSFDAPGHGRAGGSSTHITEMSEITQALIAQLGGSVEAIIAHSFGSMVVSHALQQPGVHVGRVALISSVYSFDTLLEGFQAITGASPDLMVRLKQRLEAGLGCGWYDISGETLAAKQRVPALIIHDEGDREVPASDSQKLHAQWQGSTLHLTSGLGHFRILQHADVVQRVAAFLGASEARS